MHQSEQPHSHNEKIDEINLPAIPREDITAEKIFQLAEMANTPSGVCKAFVQMMSAYGSPKMEEILYNLKTPEWLERVVAATPEKGNESAHRKVLLSWIYRWKTHHELISESLCEPENKRQNYPIKQIHYSDAILSRLSLTKKQQRLLDEIEYLPPNPRGYFSGMGVSIRMEKIRDEFSARSLKLKEAGEYIRLAVDAWILAGIPRHTNLAFSELSYVAARVKGSEHQLVTTIMEDLITTRFDSGFYDEDFIRKINGALGGFCYKPLSPEQYERINLYPGEFYTAVFGNNYRYAVKVLKDMLSSKEATAKFVQHKQSFPIEFALSREERELAWHLSLASDSSWALAKPKILHSEKLPDWTARAPFVLNNENQGHDKTTPSKISQSLFRVFLESLIRRELAKAERLLHTLSLSLPHTEQILALHQLLKVVGGDSEAASWSGFRGDSPFTYWFTGWSPIFRSFRYILESDSVADLTPQLETILKRIFAEEQRLYNHENNQDEPGRGVLMFSSLLASYGLVEAAYNFLEDRSFNDVYLLAYALEDEKKLTWWKEMERVNNVIKRRD